MCTLLFLVNTTMPQALRLWQWTWQRGSILVALCMIQLVFWMPSRQADAQDAWLNWPDRRPIARWFVAEHAQQSAINPRAYLWDPLFDVSNQSAFTAAMLAWTDSVIANMNAMNPRPQGIIIWDLEGQEFDHAFTYVGHPSKLPVLAPEMDAVADAVFAKLATAGYKLGLTLRPNTFSTGPTLPATCTSNLVSAYFWDVFVLTGAVFPNLPYTCSSTDVWTAMGPGWGWQTVSDVDATIYATLSEKITYAKNRWGITMFYIDSTVYSNGSPFSVSPLTQLHTDFPDIILFPENELVSYWGVSAPYDNPTSQAVKDLYPQAFTLVITLGWNMTDPDTYRALVTSVRNGDILMVDGWWDNPKNATILKIYQDASLMLLRLVR